MLEEVGVRVEDGVLNVIAVEKIFHLRQQLELMNGRLTSLTRSVVGLTSPLHGYLEVCDLLVDLILQVLRKVWLAK